MWKVSEAQSIQSDSSVASYLTGLTGFLTAEMDSSVLLHHYLSPPSFSKIHSSFNRDRVMGYQRNSMDIFQCWMMTLSIVLNSCPAIYYFFHSWRHNVGHMYKSMWYLSV